MRAVIFKSLRETWVSTLCFALALFAGEVLMGWVLPQVQENFSDAFMQFPIARVFAQALLGVEIEGEITIQLMQAFMWVHPFTLAMYWAHEIMFATRFPAGEIDRGTVDVLLGLPVSRRRVYVGETLAWMASGLVLLGGAFAGYLVGAATTSVENAPPLPHIGYVLANVYALYLAVGGVAFLISALSDHRTRAIGVAFGLVVASFLVNFLIVFWEPAQRISSFCILTYLQPATILRDQAFPTSDVLILIATAAVAWTIGLEIVARRSICTT